MHIKLYCLHHQNYLKHLLLSYWGSIPLQLSLAATSGLGMFMIKLTEHVNCCKTEIFEWSRICTEFGLFQHQFWQEWENDIFSEKNAISSLITQP